MPRQLPEAQDQADTGGNHSESPERAHSNSIAMLPRGSSGSAAFRPQMSPSASHLTKMPTLDRLLKYTKAPGAESLRFFQASSNGRIERMPPTPSRPQQVPSWQIPDSQTTGFSQVIVASSSQNSSSQQDGSMSSQTPLHGGGHSQPELPPKPSEAAARIEDRIFQTQRSQILETFNRLVTELQDVKGQLASQKSGESSSFSMPELESQVKDILKPDLQRLEQSIIMATSSCPSVENLTREIVKLRAEVQEAKAEALRSMQSVSELQAALVALRAEMLKRQEPQPAPPVAPHHSPIPLSVGPVVTVSAKASCKPSASAVHERPSATALHHVQPRIEEDAESYDMLADDDAEVEEEEERRPLIKRPMEAEVADGRSAVSIKAQQPRAGRTLGRQESFDGSQSLDGWTMGVEDYLKQLSARLPVASPPRRQEHAQPHTSRPTRDSSRAATDTKKPKGKGGNQPAAPAQPKEGPASKHTSSARKQSGRTTARQPHSRSTPPEGDTVQANETPRTNRDKKQNLSIFDFESSPDTQAEIHCGWGFKSNSKRQRK